MSVPQESIGSDEVVQVWDRLSELLRDKTYDKRQAPGYVEVDRTRVRAIVKPPRSPLKVWQEFMKDALGIVNINFPNSAEEVAIGTRAIELGRLVGVREYVHAEVPSLSIADTLFTPIKTVDGAGALARLMEVTFRTESNEDSVYRELCEAGFSFRLLAEGEQPPLIAVAHMNCGGGISAQRFLETNSFGPLNGKFDRQVALLDLCISKALESMEP